MQRVLLEINPQTRKFYAWVSALDADNFIAAVERDPSVAFAHVDADDLLESVAVRRLSPADPRGMDALDWTVPAEMV